MREKCFIGRFLYISTLQQVEDGELSASQIDLSTKLSAFLPTLFFLWENILAYLLIELFLEYSKEIQ